MRIGLFSSERLKIEVLASEWRLSREKRLVLVLVVVWVTRLSWVTGDKDLALLRLGLLELESFSGFIRSFGKFGRAFSFICVYFGATLDFDGFGE